MWTLTSGFPAPIKLQPCGKNSFGDSY
uniref:Uncharacterized protein n=1 Tax=Rhizophora mucronata TaxID=61149 RepID=A0A2P2JKP1_RHIMU